MESNSRNDKKYKKWNRTPEMCNFVHNGNNMIDRLIIPRARLALTQFRALCLTGPRQSGKTTLSKLLFKNKPYFNFENPILQFEVEQSPEKFLGKIKHGAVLDEVQRAPDIFRYLHEMLDRNTSRGQYILTGSNNFLLFEKVSQSLAGRVGYLTLLPLSYNEIKGANLLEDDLARLMLYGGYPEIWDQQLLPSLWIESYISTYIQRDVRLLRNIKDLGAFKRFISLCANTASQLVNRDELSRNTRVDTKTIQAWLGLLDHSYIAFMIQPWYANPNKRIIKSPKLYFYDTGLLCFMLGITSVHALRKSPHYGAIFENWVMSEIRKNIFNNGYNDQMYFYRDSSQNEVDLILERAGQVMAIEIKSAGKFHADHLRGLNYINKFKQGIQKILIHAGRTNQVIDESVQLLPWTEVANI